MANYRLLYERMDGRIRKGWLPVEIAFIAARAIAREKHGGVTLVGKWGVATFNAEGGVDVDWITTGQSDSYGPHTTVCL